MSLWQWHSFLASLNSSLYLKVLPRGDVLPVNRACPRSKKDLYRVSASPWLYRSDPQELTELSFLRLASTDNWSQSYWKVVRLMHFSFLYHRSLLTGCGVWTQRRQLMMQWSDMQSPGFSEPASSMLSEGHDMGRLRVQQSLPSAAPATSSHRPCPYSLLMYRSLFHSNYTVTNGHLRNADTDTEYAAILLIFTSIKRTV